MWTILILIQKTIWFTVVFCQAVVNLSKYLICLRVLSSIHKIFTFWNRTMGISSQIWRYSRIIYILNYNSNKIFIRHPNQSNLKYNLTILILINIDSMNSRHINIPIFWNLPFLPNNSLFMIPPNHALLDLKN